MLQLFLKNYFKASRGAAYGRLNFKPRAAHLRGCATAVKDKLNRNRFSAAVLGGAVLFSSMLVLSDDFAEASRQVVRLTRAFLTGTAIYLYYYPVVNGHYASAEEYLSELQKCHQVGSRWFTNMCLANRGLFIKIGQTIASLNHVLPPTWTQTLAVLRDQTLKQDFRYVKKIIQEDLGEPIESLFSAFEEKPLASASIAQVHKAVTMNGDPVAVKVQFYYLQQQYPYDIKAIQLFLRVLEYIAPYFKLGWTFKLVEEKLKDEIDFNVEARNLLRCKEMLEDVADVTVPEIHSSLSSGRILTMEFIDGVKFGDQIKLSGMGYSVPALVTRLIEIFALQIFRYGFVHADPHPSNIYVRSTANNKAQLVLLDHGLYEDISPSNRELLARLWISGTTSDIEGLKKVADELNIKDHTVLWEIMFQRPYILASTGQLKLLAKLTAEDRRALIKKASAERLELVTEILQRLPSQFLLVLRNINIIRSIAQDSKESVDRYYLIARQAYAERATWQDSDSSPTTNWAYYRLLIYASLFFFSVKYKIAKVRYNLACLFLSLTAIYLQFMDYIFY